MRLQTEGLGTLIAGGHAGEAADTLRLAATIADPYMRADAIWEALERVRCAADRLRSRRAEACNDIARYLEAGCEGRDEPPGGETLEGYARTLEGIQRFPSRRIRAADPSSLIARTNPHERRRQ